MAAENHEHHLTAPLSGGSSRPPRDASHYQWPLYPMFDASVRSHDTEATSTSGVLRQDLRNVLSRGLGPLVEQSNPINLSTWLRHTSRSPNSILAHHQRRDSNSNFPGENQATVMLPAGSQRRQFLATSSPDVVVSMEAGDAVGVESSDPSNSTSDSPPAPAPPPPPQQTGTVLGSDSVFGQYVDASRQNPELRATVAVIEKYMPFILILLAKLIFDHKVGILVLVGLVITFFHANSVIRREVSKQAKRNLRSLLSVIVNLLTCVFFLLFFVFESERLYYNLIFLPPFIVHPPSIWDLLFVVGITDFVLKLITIVTKAIVVALPGSVLPFRKKGKYYLFIEQTSQSYRSLVTIRPWLVYLLEAYSGASKVVGVALCAAYVVAKGTHLVRGFREWRNALGKLVQTVTYGCTPSREQVDVVGSICPICQDNFRQPTLLNCKHIFCEECVSMWFDRERTCPMCRAQIADDPTWRDGGTTYFLQVF